MENTIVPFKELKHDDVFVIVGVDPTCGCNFCKNFVGRTFRKDFATQAIDIYTDATRYDMPEYTACVLIDLTKDNFELANARFQMMKLGKGRNYGEYDGDA